MENLNFNNSSRDSSRTVGDPFLISGSPQTNFGRIGEWASGNLQPCLMALAFERDKVDGRKVAWRH